MPSPRPAPSRRHRSVALLPGLALAVGVAVLPVLPAAPAAVPVASVAATESYPVPSNGVFQVEGHGWGHGIGMSQYGAQGAAQRGLGFAQILDFYYPGTTPTQAGNPTIKVALRDDMDNDLIVLDDNGDLTATDLSPSPKPAYALRKADGSRAAQWGILRNSAGLHALYRDSATGPWTDVPAGWHGVPGPIRITSASGTVRVLFPAAPGATPPTRRYPGAAVGVASGSGVVSTVQVPREEYLRGVLPGEMGSSFPTEALRAQAVAARTFASWRQEHPRDAWTDVRDNTDDQVYLGAVYQGATDAAVAATAGTVLVHNFRSAFTQFSASNGGHTRAGSAPYLIAQADPYDGVSGSSVNSWTASLPVSAVQKAFPAVGRLTSIDVTQRDGNGEWGGRVESVVLRGVDGAGRATAVTTTGSGVKAAYSWPENRNPLGLRSNWWRIAGVAPSAPQQVTATAGDATATVSWAPPSSEGSSAVSEYLVTATPGNRSARVGATARSATLTGLDNGTAHTLRVTALSAAGSSPAVAAAAVTPVWRYADFTAAGPTRIYDSRTAGGVLPQGGSRSIAVVGQGGVPANATAVAVTVTVTQGSAPSYLTVSPTGFPRPTASSLNWAAGEDRANTVVARLGSGGRVDLYNDRGSVHVVVDVLGWWVPDSAGATARLRAVTPQRTLDSRVAPGALGAGQSIAAKLDAHAPADAGAALLNLTAVAPDRATVLSARPAGTPYANTSTINVRRGENRAAATVVPLGSRDAAIRNDVGRVHAVVDAMGWFVPRTGVSGGAGRVSAVSPQRLLDTRDVGGPLGANSSRRLAVAGGKGMPSSGIAAVLVNVTAVGARGGTFLRLDDGAPGAKHSNLNVADGAATANLVLVPLAADGSITLYSSAAATDVVVDLVGIVTG